MSIRKFRKNMKPIVWMITIFFLVTLVVGYGSSYFSNRGNKKEIAFKLNGEDVSDISVQRAIREMENSLNMNLGVALDKDFIGTLAFNDLVNENILLESSKEFKIKVSNSDINKALDSTRAKFPTKNDFKRYISTLGFTTDMYKQELEKRLMLNAVIDKIVSNVNVTDGEIKDVYTANILTTFNGKSFDEVKDEIRNELLNQKKIEKLTEFINEKRNTMNLEILKEEYTKYRDKVEQTVEGFNITTLDIDKKALNNLAMTNGDLATAIKYAKAELEYDAKILNKIKDGVKINKNLPLIFQLNDAMKQKMELLSKEINPTPEELKAFFEENKEGYDIKKSAVANIALYNMLPSEEDKKVAYKKAEEILAKVTPENFSEMAKEYSQGPSKDNGGSLGTFGKGQMVKQFEDAVFEAEVGKVYPKIVETQFGYHIIYVSKKDGDKVTASHILIVPEPSEKTIKAAKELVDKAVVDLNNKTIKFDDLKKDKRYVVFENVEDITEEGYISKMGYSPELVADIFKAELNKAQDVIIKNIPIIYEKLEQTEPKEANYEEIQDIVKKNYIDFKVQEKIKEIESTIK